jgi:hypothetical protein
VQYAGRDEMYAGVIIYTQFVIKSTREMHHFPEYTTSPGFTLPPYNALPLALRHTSRPYPASLGGHRVSSEPTDSNDVYVCMTLRLIHNLETQGFLLSAGYSDGRQHVFSRCLQELE